jgi:hypothetical protein
MQEATAKRKKVMMQLTVAMDRSHLEHPYDEVHGIAIEGKGKSPVRQRDYLQNAFPGAGCVISITNSGTKPP